VGSTLEEAGFGVGGGDAITSGRDPTAEAQEVGTTTPLETVRTKVVSFCLTIFDPRNSFGNLVLLNEPRRDSSSPSKGIPSY